MHAQTFFLLYSLPFFALCMLCWRQSCPGLPQGPASSPNLRYVLLWLLAGVLIRLPLLWDAGFHYDTGTYKAWALKLSDPANAFAVYEDGYFADYPPLYMYILAMIGALARWSGLADSSHFTALIKLPPLLCDIGVSLLLLRIARQQASPRPLLIASLYLFNPAIIFDTALWGQTDSLLLLLVLLGWQAWRKDRLVLASLALAASVAFKPQGAVFAGVYGVAVILSAGWRRSLLAAFAGALSFGLLILPFAWRRELDWIVSLYMGTAATYDYLTVNAYNLWALLGWNWQKDAGELFGLRTQQWAMLLSAGLLLLIASLTGLRLRRTPVEQRGDLMAWAFVLASIAFFVLAPRMHERYLLPVLPLLLLVLQRRFDLLLVIGWSLLALANMAYVYHHYIGLGQVPPGFNVEIAVISGGITLLALLSFAHVYAPGWLSFGGAQALRLFHAIWPNWQFQQPARERWGRHESLAVFGLMIAALLLGLLRVGTANYPQSGVSAEQFTVELRFGEPVSPRILAIHAGHGSAKLTLYERDANNWRKLLDAHSLEGFYKFHRIDLPNAGSARRYRLHFEQQTGAILEVGLLDQSQQLLRPAQSLSISADTAAMDSLSALSDEPDSLQAGRGYLAEPYFDEIYHARTAFEYLHHLPVYEFTHPPLGKWLISRAIASFGMTPLGMRSAGVVASALLVGVLACGAWLIVGTRRALWLAGLFSLFEFSRFSIGRIATIDSFLMLFLSLAALCLWQAMQRKPDWRDGWRLSPWLLAAGLALGAAIATKWIALYFGAGVFVLFCAALWPQQKGEWLGPGHWWLNHRAHLGGAALALGLVPLMVYLLSYIPFLDCLQNPPSLFSREGLEQVWQSQKDMFGYHARLSDSHPFSSPFYTWPLLLKPLWLFIEESGGLRSSITLLGNPLVCWGGLVAVISLAASSRNPQEKVLILGAIASLYLPWVAVGRISFIYHYYPLIPFLILALSLFLARLDLRLNWQRRVVIAAPTIAALLFVWFYPAISGWPVAGGYFKSLHWLPGWWML